VLGPRGLAGHGAQPQHAGLGPERLGHREVELGPMYPNLALAAQEQRGLIDDLPEALTEPHRAAEAGVVADDLGAGREQRLERGKVVLGGRGGEARAREHVHAEPAKALP
jgi:hypothetical protein